MKIINYRPFEEITEDLKNIPMLTNPDKKPYKNSNIKLITAIPENLNITALYYLKDKLEFQRKLREELLKEWYDTLDLKWVLTYEWDDWQEYSLMPPVVEIVERDVKIMPREWEIAYDKTFKIKYPVLLDWIHRTLLAKELWLPITTFYIENVDIETPAYSHPNTWAELKEHTEIPSNPKEKKNYIAEDAKKYYKDFSPLVYSHFRESK